MIIFLFLYLQKINEKPIVVIDYESGRAIPNHQILAKMERTLGEYILYMWVWSHCHVTAGMYLIGERAGQSRVLGRGMKRKAAS